MSRIWFLLLALVLGGCNSTNKPLPPVQDAAMDFLNDSLYKYKDFTGTLNDEWLDENSVKQYFLFDSLVTDELLNNDKAPIQIPYYGSRAVAKQSMVGKIQPIIVYVSSDDYSSYVCILLNNNHPVAYKEIAGGWSGGPDFQNDSMLAVSRRYCNVLSSKAIDYFIIQEYFSIDTSSETMNELPFQTDSIHYKIGIEENGTFKETLVDSVRIPAMVSNFSPPNQ